MPKTKDGLDLFTQSWKAANPKAIVVLTHGYNDHSGRYLHVGKALNDGGFSVYAYDLRGHGLSGGQRGHTPSFEHLLDDLGTVIEDAKIDAPGKKVFVYGHSMGGNITLNFVLRRPVELSGVIATSPWLRLAFQPPALQLAIAKFIGSFAPTFSQKAALNVEAISRDTAVQTAYRTDPLLHGLISTKLFTQAVSNGASAIEQARLLKLPVLLIHGGDDKIASAAATHAFFNNAAVSDKTFKLFEGMRHETHNEFGKEGVFAEIVGWLEKHV
ncbi:MAG TPA: lysophospholipase [Anaerolineales bacterium]|nr:lysophospholipase [Anaerolineales bacterium]